MVRALMTAPAVIRAPNLTFETLLREVRERETRQNTAIGEGLAFPHARIPGLPGLAFALATLDPPLIFLAPDQKPVHFVCLTLAPEESPTLALKVQAIMAQLFLAEEFRDFLLNARSPAEVFAGLERRAISVDVPICARDIMRVPLVNVFTDTPIKEATRQMLHHRIDAVAVLHHDKTIAGELTCDRLFQSGIPDFFQQLKSVSFIREFDPFEKYFARESQMVAADLMSPDFAAMPADATLLEIVFALTVQRHPKIHVVDKNHRRIGVIDRIAVLNRVIHI